MTHASEQELLALAEGEPVPGDVRAHVHGCAGCAAAVDELQAARALLRAAPPLEPPARLVPALPARERERRRRLLAWTLAPAAAAAAVSAAVVLATRGGGSEGPAADAIRAQEAPSAKPAAPRLRGAALVRRVAGPPAAVAAALRRAGFEARAADGRVTVERAALPAVERALRGRRDGPVAVLVSP